MVDFKIGDKVYVYGNKTQYRTTIGYCLGTIKNICKYNNSLNKKPYAIVDFNIINGHTRCIRCVVYLEDLHLFCNKKGNAIW